MSVQVEPEAAAPGEPGDNRRRIVYLLGAGATQGCASFRGSVQRIVMPGLIDELAQSMRDLVDREYEGDAGITRLVNNVVDEDTDFEQLITFLEDAPSDKHKSFAAELKVIFSTVLRHRLAEVRDELGPKHSELYAVLVDMHDVPAFEEELVGFLTLNYDVFLEHAIENTLGYGVDYGVALQPTTGRERRIRVLKLHGSFGWASGWPIAEAHAESPGLWIPPGIRKAKSEYPFNAIWGLAREMLDCDVLRIIGCNLSPNDWDLVSLLFTSMHAHAVDGPYEVEVIAGPETAQRIAQSFPYLDVQSILEIPEIGPQVVAENLGSEPIAFSKLTDEQRGEVARNAQGKISNPFYYWLTVKGELMNRDLPSLHTPSTIFSEFVASAT